MVSKKDSRGSNQARKAPRDSPVRGRPRSSEVDASILQAAIDIIVQSGYGKLTIEGVAERAGVSRPTVYRRYDSRAQLVADAVSQAFESANPVVPDSSSAREDVRILLRNTIRMLRETPIGSVIRALVSELGHNPDLAEIARKLERSRRSLMRKAIRRGMETGEFPADLDVELAIDTILGPVYLRLLLTGSAIPDRLASGIVDLVLTSARH